MSDWKIIGKADSVLPGETNIEGSMIVGRVKEADICIPLGHMSRQHACLEVVDGALKLKDLGSSNGTYVNGVKIAEVVLKPGDIISFDQVEFVVQGSTSSDEGDDATLIRPTHAPAAEEKLAAEKLAAEKKLAEEKLAAEKKLAEEKLAAEKLAAEKKLAEEKLAAEKLAAEKKLAEERLAAEKLTAEKKLAEEKLASEKAAAEKAASHATIIDSGDNDESDATMVMPRAKAAAQHPDDEDDGFANKTMIMSSMADADVDIASSAHGNNSEIVPELKCKTKPYAGQIFQLTHRVNTIGRTSDSDIEMNDPSVSSKHAEIVIDDGVCQIRDTGSYNGVYVNKKKCQSQTLVNGDLINIGRMKLVFSDGMAVETGAGVKNIIAALPMPALPLKAIAAALGIVVVAVLAYWFMPSLPGVSSSEVKLVWQNISSGRVNPASPVAFDVNEDGNQDVVIANEKGIIDFLGGIDGDRISQINTSLNLYSSPVLIDVASDHKMDVVVISVDGAVAAYDVNARQLWLNTDLSGQSLIAQAVSAKINDDYVDDIVIATESSGVVFLDGNSGTLLTKIESLKGRVITRPLVADFNGDGIAEIVVITDQHEIAAFSVKGDQVRQMWNQSIPPVLTAPAAYTLVNGMGVVFVATQDNGLIALNSQTGGRIWQAKLDGLLFAEPVTIDTDGDQVDDLVIQTTYSGDVVAFDASNGDVRWDLKLENKIQAAPSVISAGGVVKLVLVDTEAVLYLLNGADGSIDFTGKVAQADRFVVAPLVTRLDRNGPLNAILASQNGNVFVYDLGVIDLGVN